ncbi:hypothetical protein AX15_003492 [Amanita polypyramis BW_CC]|nr:hypothetical protein AX15_003492 [Amanita polypyramis BW_CC]
MSLLDGVGVQTMSQWRTDKKVHFSPETSNWSSPQRSPRQDVDSHMDLTFNINEVQTSPVAVLVQPASSDFHTSKPGAPVDVNIKHESAFSNGMEILSTNLRKLLSDTLTNRDFNNSLPAGEALNVPKVDTAQLVNNPHKLSNISLTPKGNNVSLSEPAKAPQNGNNVIQSTNGPANDPQLKTSVSGIASRETSSNGPTESRVAPLVRNTTTAEAARLALNAAFQSQSVAVSQGGTFSNKIEPLYTNTSHEYNATKQKLRKDASLPRLQEPTSRDELNANLQNHENLKSSTPMSVSSHAVANSMDHQPKKKRRTLVLNAVVLDKKPPFSVPRASIKYGPPTKRDVSDELLFGPPKQRNRARIRKPKAQEVIIARTDEQLEELLQADVGSCGYISGEELNQANGNILANHEILKLQWQVREFTKYKSHRKAASIVYPTNEPVERFIKGLESAYGPGSLSRIRQKFPKVTSRYVYTSSELEESGAEQVSDVPTEGDHEQETIDQDTAMIEAVEMSDTISKAWASDMRIGEDGIKEDGVMIESESAGVLKRKLSSGSGEESRRTYTRLQDDPTSGNRNTLTADERTVGRWVASLEVLIKGKVYLRRRDLRKLRIILDDIYAWKNSLSDQLLETSQLKKRIRQLSEMAAEEIAFNDEENLRQKARIINRIWNRRAQS